MAGSLSVDLRRSVVGVIEGGLNGLREVPEIRQVAFPTNASKILPGYYLFIGFCVSSIVLSKRLEQGIADSSEQG